MESAVLHIANFQSRYSSNFLASMCVLSRRTRAMGLRQVMAFPYGARQRSWVAMLQDNGIAVRFLADPSSIMQATLSLACLARRENATILHTHFSRQYELEAAAARLLCMRAQMQLVWHRHSAGPTAPSFRTRVKDFFGNRVLAPHSALIAVSDQLRDAAIQSGITGNVQTIANGIAVGRIRKVIKWRAEMRQGWHIGENVFTFLHFGWDPVTKGVDLVVRACAQIKVGAPFVLVMVGRDDTVDAVREVVGSRLPAWLRIIAPVETVADLYAASDCLVSSSRWEGSPYTVGEAMAAGLPVIATDIPGVKAVSASDGVMLTSFADGSLAGRMTQLLTSEPDRRRLWGEANRNFILENYSVEQWAERVMRVYAGLLDRSGSGEKPRR